MSDFDDILKNKLDEEEAFPNMEANWAKLADRMAASGGGKPMGVAFSWRRWAAAAAALLFLGSNAALAFFAVKQYHENQRLQADVASLKAQRSGYVANRTDTLWQEKVVTRVDTVFIYRDASSLPQSAWADSKKGTPSVSNQKRSATGTIMPSNGVATQQTIHQNTPINKGKEGGLSPLKSSLPVASQDEQSKGSVAQQSVSPAQLPAIDSTSGQASVQKGDGNLRPPVSPNGADSVRVAQTKVVSPLDSMTAQLDQQLDKKGEPQSDNLNKKDDNAPIIRKNRPKLALKALFGTHATLAIPAKNEEGFPQMKGWGFTAELGFLDHWRIGGAVDFGRLTYDLEEEKYHYRERYRRWNLPKEPMPFNRDTVLERIHGNQVRTIWSADVKYVFDETAGLRPYVRLGYTVAKIESKNTQFEYKIANSNDILVQTRVQPTVKERNIMQLGVGLEKAFEHLNVYAQADYQSDFSATSFNLWVLQAGVKYVF